MVGLDTTHTVDSKIVLSVGFHSVIIDTSYMVASIVTTTGADRHYKLSSLGIAVFRKILKAIDGDAGEWTT